MRSTTLVQQKYLFKNVIKSVGILFFCVGILFASIGGISTYNLYQADKNLNHAIGTIELVNYNYVFVKYDLNGQEMKGVLNFYSSNFREGQQIDILYDENDPYDLQTTEANFMYYIFVGVGIIIATIGGELISSEHKREKIQKELLQNGRKVYATISGIGVDPSISNNYRHPFIIYCVYDDGDGQKEYVSGPIWDELNDSFIGKDIPLYLDQTNKDLYYVDVREYQRK